MYGKFENFGTFFLGKEDMVFCELGHKYPLHDGYGCCADKMSDIDDSKEIHFTDTSNNCKISNFVDCPGLPTRRCAALGM